MDVLGGLASVDSLAGRLIELVHHIVIEIKRAQRDVATLKNEEVHLQDQYKKLSDRFTRVQEANEELRKVHAGNPKLGESQSKQGNLEELLKRLEISLESDLKFLKSLQIKEVKTRWQRWKKVFWAFLGKGAAKLQKQMKALVNRIEEDCRQLDEAIAVRTFTGGVRVEAGVGRLEVGVGRVEVGVDQLEAGVGRVEVGLDQLVAGQQQLIEGLGYHKSNLQFSTTPGAKSGQKCQRLPEYLVARQNLPSDVEKMLTDGGTLGISGMGGIGKTTFAKQVFNEISWKFEYTCFVDNVKGIPFHELDERIRGKWHQRGRGSGSSVEWTELEQKKILIVMDDVDSDGQLGVLPNLRDFGTGSLKIFTTRNGNLCKRHDMLSFEMGFLEPKAARKLFCQHAFNSEDIPEELRKMTKIRKHVEDIVKKCDCLPLSLEVIGKHLYVCGDHQNSETWDDIIDALTKAQSVDGDKEDKLFANLKVSYDALAEEEQQMFRDIATFFFEKRLDVTLAAINISKGKSKRAALCWGNLVRRCLVKEKTREEIFSLEDIKFEYQEVWMHEHLRDLGKRLAGTSYLPANEIMDKINSDEVQVHHLRSGYFTPVRSPEKVLTFSSLAKLTNLKYLTLYQCSPQGASQDFPRELVLLQWTSHWDDVMHDFPSSQLHAMRTLAVLELQFCYYSGFAFLIKGLGTLVNLMILKLKVIQVYRQAPVKLPENFGGLTKLQRLTLEDGDWILPESFGQLSSLEFLIFKRTGITHLPESFGNLPSLKTLVFNFCTKLTHFPDSFGNLYKLEKLLIGDCGDIEVLADTFGSNLTSLRDLFIYQCPKLKQLPQSFSNLSGLRTLICRDMYLIDIEGAFDNFSMHEHMENLELELCNRNLPESFSHLSAKTLQSLRLKLTESKESYLEFPDGDCNHDFMDFGIVSDDDTGVTEKPNRLSTIRWDFPTLEGLTSQAKELALLLKSLGERLVGDCIDLLFELEEGPTSSNQQFLSMKRLEIWRGLGVQRLPDCIGNLTLLQELEIGGNALMELPDSIGHLGALKELFLWHCGELETLPESIGHLRALKDLSISRCPKLETLPESMGQLGALKKLTIEFCTLKILPESMEQLGSLEELQIWSCDRLVTLPEGMGNLSSLNAVSLRGCSSLKAVPRNWGRVASVKTSSPEQASPSSSSRTRLTLLVRGCPALQDFLENLNWDSKISDAFKGWTYVRETRLS